MGHEKHIRFVGLQSILGMFSSCDTFIERKCKKNVIKKAFDRQIFEKIYMMRHETLPPPFHLCPIYDYENKWDFFYPPPSQIGQCLILGNFFF